MGSRPYTCPSLEGGADKTGWEGTSNQAAFLLSFSRWFLAGAEAAMSLPGPVLTGRPLGTLAANVSGRQSGGSEIGKQVLALGGCYFVS